MNVAIWGTGEYCNKLLDYFSEINASLSEKGLSIVNCSYYIDNAACDSRNMFEGKPVIKPNAIRHNEVDAIIIAVAKFQEILQQIENEQLPIRNIVVYKPKYNIKLLYDLQRINPDMAFHQIGDSFRQKLELMGEVAKNQNSRAEVFWEHFKGTHSREDVVAAIEELNDIEFNEQLYNNFELKADKKNGAHCIGIYYPRFYNGGVERVISQLMPIFIEMEYKVVLINEEVCADKDYEYPPEVIRVIMPKRGDDRFAWYEKFGAIIKHYDIDIMYLHDYDVHSVEKLVVYYLRMMDMGVIIHIHSHYRAIPNIQLFMQPYRVADKIIVLSREDKEFWLKNGVAAEYIPNPIDISIDYIFHKKHSDKPVVLWLGRIDQKQKQVYDVVGIMSELVKIIPNACLRIIGAADKKEILDELKRRITETGLEHNIFFMGYSVDPWKLCEDGDVLLMTSAFEGFPMVLAESKMAGMPLVTYSLPYLELLKDGKGYISVGQNDVRETAKQLSLVIKDKKLQNKLSSDARDSIEKFAKYDMKGNWDNILKSIIGII